MTPTEPRFTLRPVVALLLLPVLDGLGVVSHLRGTLLHGELPLVALGGAAASWCVAVAVALALAISVHSLARRLRPTFRLRWEAGLVAVLTVAVVAGTWSPWFLVCALPLWLVVQRWRWAPWLMVALAAAAIGSSISLTTLSVRPGGGGTDRPDVVLLTLDTFRADHVGAVGGFRRPIATPHLDGLIADGLLFEQGVAHVPLTLPSHASMLSGRPAHESGLLRNGQKLPAEMGLVSEALLATGFRTGAFLSSRVLMGETGLARGFEHYDDRMDGGAAHGVLLRLGRSLGLKLQHRGARDGQSTVKRALRWLHADASPAFLWVHLYDAHAPYAPPAPFDTRYPAEPVESLKLRTDGKRQMGTIFRIRPERVSAQMALYAGAVTYTDSLVGELLEGLRPDTQLIVVADHGESLDEHDFVLNHGSHLYQPSIRVPIVLTGLNVSPGRVAHPVPVSAVAGTILALGGVSSQAPSLLDLVHEPVEEIISYAPTQRSRPDFDVRPKTRVAFRRGSDKWIVDSLGAVEHYDLSVDPGEWNSDQHQAEEYRARGEQLLDALPDAPGGSDELTEALEALGYLE